MRFYVKKGGWGYNVYHRATHSYLTGCKTMEEVAAYIEAMNAKAPEELWYTLLFVRRITIPRRDVVTGTAKDTSYQQQEDSYRQAWRYGTEEFYDAYPELMVEEQLDYDLINRVRLAEARRQDEERERKIAAMFRKKVFRHVDEYGVVRLHVRKLA